MDRRKALKIGIGMTAGAALGGIEGCAPSAKTVRKGHQPENMDDYLANLDSQLDRVRQSRFVEGFTQTATGKPLTEAVRNRLEPAEKQFQEILHSLLLTQSFRDLSEEGQFHPGMQQRIARNLDNIDASVFEVTETLSKLAADEKSAIRKTLREHPGLAMHIAESLDDQAALAGVSRARRTQLRSMMTQASFRMSNNDPGVIIDEYVEKVRRASEPSRADISSAEMAAASGGEAFWRYRDQLAAANSEDGSLTSSQFEQTSEPGSKPIRIGAKLLGISVLTFGASALFVSMGAVIFVVGMTVGAILFAIGLITLIIGAIIKAAN